ncbi:MAG TPA: methyl-accepting chemotaxis protein [Patescibacteria group bacterium]|nr:methyl-accepting chemotaxis protein [Patescibacteria group bacterium]
MFRNLSYQKKMLLSIMPVIIAGLLAIGVYSYLGIKAIVEEELSRSMAATTSETANSINTWLQSHLIEPETIAATPAAKVVNTDYATTDAMNTARFLYLQEKYPTTFTDIYASDRNGVFHTIIKSGNGTSINAGDIKNRDYFQSIMNGGPPQITPPLISRSTNLPTIFLVAPIKDEQNRPQGLIGAGVTLQAVQKICANLKFGKSGYGVMVAKDGTFIQHPNKDFVMQKNITKDFEDPTIKELGRRLLSGEQGIYRYVFNGDKKIAFYDPVPVTGWGVAIVINEDEFFAPVNKMVTSIAIAIFLVMLVSSLVVWITARRMTRPLLEMAAFATEITQGNLTVRPLNADSQDELGQLARSFNQMTANLRELVGQIVTNSEQVNQFAGQLNQSAAGSAKTSNEVALSSGEVATGLESVSASAEEITASSENVGANLSQIANNAAAGNEVARGVEQQALSLQQSANHSRQTAVNLYDEISGRVLQAIADAKIVDEISQMASSIASIAGQTNLLALNAAIEAARAGEQGRGFAVVAEEVRKLAEESAKAVGGIQDLTKKVQEAIGVLVENSNELLQFINGTVRKDYDAFVNVGEQYKKDADAFLNITGDIGNKLRQVSEEMGEINKAIESVASTIEESAAGTQVISKGTVDVSQALAEISRATGALNDTAAGLNQSAARFRIR